MTQEATLQVKEPVPLERIDLDLRQLRPKNEPWKRARELDSRKTAEFIEPDKVYELLNNLKNPRDKALFCLLYLTASRIEEVVRYRKRLWCKKKVLLIKSGRMPKKAWIQDYKKQKGNFALEPGITKRDIKVIEKENRKIAIVRLRNLKNKQKDENTKIIPITLDNEINNMFFKHIQDYIYTLEDYEELFPFQNRNAEIIISAVGWNPHFIRKVRLTHLVRLYNFSDQELRIYAGWTDTRPSKYYVKLKWEDLLKKL